MKSFLTIVVLLTYLLILTIPLTAQVPEWAKGAVWYQIFPERFRNGNPNNDPIKERVLGNLASDNIDWQVHPWASDWYKLQIWEKARGVDFYTLVFDRRYGGDLIGVIEKLDYLKDLGIDAIYFNPIFEAPSLHKYDATTYHHVDNNFGLDRDGDWVAIQSEREDTTKWTFTQADEVFLDLIKEAHDKGIKVIIDGVFNHCGRTFWAFQDVIKNQQNSKYKNWFVIRQWDDPSTPDTSEFDYESWWGFKDLPVFAEDENGLVPPVKEYIFNITRRWMDPNKDGDPSDGVDGWRLDVPEEVNPKFWEEYYRFVKSINPEAYLVGEIWKEAPEWIEKKRFDAVMNYPLAKLMVHFFIDRKKAISVSEFDRQLKRLRKLYPEATNHILMNLIDSHDTDRVGSMIKNPDRNYDRQAGLRDNPHYDPRKPTKEERRIQKLIAIFQMTYIGAPMIYYGDEAGMWGGDDPDDRKPMLWPEFVYENETYVTVRPDLKDSDENKFDWDLFNHYKKLIHIRHHNPALKKGNFETSLVDDQKKLYGYTRKFEQNEVVVILNNSEKRQVLKYATSWPDETRVKDVLNDNKYVVKDGILKLSVEKKWGVILVKEK